MLRFYFFCSFVRFLNDTGLDRNFCLRPGLSCRRSSNIASAIVQLCSIRSSMHAHTYTQRVHVSLRERGICVHEISDSQQLVEQCQFVINCFWTRKKFIILNQTLINSCVNSKDTSYYSLLCK